jgi:hypothetical protein
MLGFSDGCTFRVSIVVFPFCASAFCTYAVQKSDVLNAAKIKVRVIIDSLPRYSFYMLT